MSCNNKFSKKGKTKTKEVSIKYENNILESIVFKKVSSFKYTSLITQKRNDIRPIHSFKNKIFIALKIKLVLEINLNT